MSESPLYVETLPDTLPAVDLRPGLIWPVSQEELQRPSVRELTPEEVEAYEAEHGPVELPPPNPLCDLIEEVWIETESRCRIPVQEDAQ